VYAAHEPREKSFGERLWKGVISLTTEKCTVFDGAAAQAGRLSSGRAISAAALGSARSRRFASSLVNAAGWASSGWLDNV